MNDTKPDFSKAELAAFEATRKQRVLTDGRIRLVSCPKCGAEVGQDCRTSGWYVAKFHAGRVKQVA